MPPSLGFPLRARPASGFGPAWRTLVLVLAGSLLAGPRARGAGDEEVYRINIVSTVDRVYTLFSKKPPEFHSKQYAIGGIKMSNDHEGPPVVPVDEDALLGELRRALAARGFHECPEGKAPDIVITLHYGRSKMHNPNTEGITPIANQSLTATPAVGSVRPGTDFTHVPVVSWSGGDYTKERMMMGSTSRLDYEDSEKLFLSVTAWEFPGFVPKPGKKMLWRTTVTVDDPDQDLNPIAGDMLTAGGNYFDQDTHPKIVSVLSSDSEASPAASAPAPGHP